MFLDVKTAYGAIGNGTTNDRTAFTNADAAGGTLYVPRGTYLIGSNLTLTSDIRFEQGAKLKPAAGVAVTLAGSLDAGVFQVFDLTNAGSVVTPKAVQRMIPQWWGAVATGGSTTNDATAIQAAIDACSTTAGIVYFPPGHYRTTATLTIPATENGMMLVGAGWSFGATPANNSGSFIEYSGTSGEALKIGPSTSSGSIVYNLYMKDLAVQATSSSYSGNLVDMRMVGKARFDNVGFLGLELATSATAGALMYGNAWVDVQFIRCWFRTALTGVKKAALSGWGDYTDVVVFDGCEFGRCDTSIDLQGSVQSVSVDRSTFEPAVSGAAAPVLIAGACTSVARSWFGDSNGTAGTWVRVGGSGGSVTGNYVTGGVVGIEVMTGTFAVAVESNTLDLNGTAVLVKGTANTRVSNNHMNVPNNGVGVDVEVDTSCVISNNTLYPAGTLSTGFILRAGSAGVLNQLRSASTTTAVNDLSSGGWTITQYYDTTFASAVGGFSPSRFANVKSATDQATAETDGRLNFNYVVGRYGVESQGYFALTGTGAGNPASSTRFIGGASTTTDLYINAPSRIRLDISGSHALELNLDPTTNDYSAAVLLVRQGGAWTAKRVYQGAADSAGTGRRRLEVDN